MLHISRKLILEAHLKYSSMLLLCHCCPYFQAQKGLEPFDGISNEAPVDIVVNETLEERMWTWNYVGLYSQYAAVGLLYGMSGMSLNFCIYHYKGDDNMCANANGFIFLAWSFKLFYAIGTDSFRPWGLRRTPYMIAGWAGALIILFVTACAAESLDASSWVGLMMVLQAFVMLSDVPADGYCVELGQREDKESRGQILATAQRIRFSFSVLSGCIQSFLVNGPTTNAKDCEISFENCWAWGLSVGEYYGFMFCIVLVLFIPICYLKEIDPNEFPTHTPREFFAKIWDTLTNLTTLYMLIYVVGISILTATVNNAGVFLQYYIMEMTNFQAGIDTITTYLALVAGVWIFQKYV